MKPRFLAFLPPDYTKAGIILSIVRSAFLTLLSAFCAFAWGFCRISGYVVLGVAIFAVSLALGSFALAVIAAAIPVAVVVFVLFIAAGRFDMVGKFLFQWAAR